MKKYLAIILASLILLSTVSLIAQSKKGLKATQAWLKKLKGKEYTLAELKSLQELNLWHAKVTDSGLVYLKELKTLKKLKLWGRKVTDSGLIHLKELKSLQTLELIQTQVTDAGLAHLKELKSLQTLNLGSTQVTDVGLRKLQKALPSCKIIR